MRCFSDAGFEILITIIMKSKIKVFLFALVLIFSSSIYSPKALAQQPYVSFQVFYDELSPYGSWVDYPNYGYVWLPDAGPDFVPYSTNGHWIYTDYGWTWFSNFEWGWAPFHYGRWNFDHYYGWFWVPDGEWGPAWVSWRSADGYYGWSPLEPGISISLSFGRSYDRYDDHWIFVRDRDIDRADIYNYYVGQNDHDRIVRRSSVINNTYVDRNRNTTYITGPDRSQFQRVTGRKVRPVEIQEYNQPGQIMRNDQISIYRPRIRETRDYAQRSEPSRIKNLKDVKVPAERNVRRDQQQNDMRQQSARPVERTIREQPQNNIKQQNNNPPQNIRREVQNNEVRQQSNPPQNTRREVQQNEVRQQSNPPQNTRREVQQNNTKKQDNPPQNLRREKRANNSKSADDAKKAEKKKTGNNDEKIKKE